MIFHAPAAATHSGGDQFEEVEGFVPLFPQADWQTVQRKNQIRGIDLQQ